jgi:hypothetical protein
VSEDQVSIKAHYERFPATVKGAFVVRCIDGDPHQVIIRAARVVDVGGGSSRPIDMQSVMLQAAPRADLFVPFEFGVMELGAGWYELECEADIDGRAHAFHMQRRFAMPWPRASVRRGAVPVGKKLTLEGGPVKVDHVDCGGESATVRYSAGAPVDLTLTADGSSLPVLETEFDEESGEGSATTYPLLKTYDELAIQARRGAATAVLELRLP